MLDGDVIDCSGMQTGGNYFYKHQLVFNFKIGKICHIFILIIMNDKNIMKENVQKLFNEKDKLSICLFFIKYS